MRRYRAFRQSAGGRVLRNGVRHNALNDNFVEQRAWECDHYSDHAANVLAGLIALARD
jgi:hypothetical protein